MSTNPAPGAGANPAVIDQLATVLNSIPESELLDAGVPAEFLSRAAQHDHVTICSIYPRRLISKAYTHGRGIKYYTIGEGSYDKPVYLPIYNTYTKLMATMQVNPDERPGMVMQPLACDRIAKDLVQEWGGDHPANRHGFIGIAIISGDTATPQELQAMKLAQDNFARANINKADMDFFHQVKGATYDAPRFWAEYLGVRDPKAHGWYRVHEPKTYQKCPFCAEDVVTEATVCKSCAKDLVAEALKKDVRVDLEKWPEVKRVYLAMTSKIPSVGAPSAPRTS